VRLGAGRRRNGTECQRGRDELLIVLVGSLIVFEALATAVWLAQLLPALPMHSGATLIIIALRALIGALLFLAGRWVRARRPSGARLAAIVLGASAVLRTFEIGAGMSPSDLTPTWRGPIVGAYWVYVCLVAWYLLGRQSRDSGHP
jgi:hypothetical protein